MKRPGRRFDNGNEEIPLRIDSLKEEKKKFFLSLWRQLFSVMIDDRFFSSSCVFLLTDDDVVKGLRWTIRFLLFILCVVDIDFMPLISSLLIVLAEKDEKLRRCDMKLSDFMREVPIEKIYRWWLWKDATIEQKSDFVSSSTENWIDFSNHLRSIDHFFYF